MCEYIHEFIISSFLNIEYLLTNGCLMGTDFYSDICFKASIGTDRETAFMSAELNR